MIACARARAYVRVRTRVRVCGCCREEARWYLACNTHAHSLLTHSLLPTHIVIAPQEPLGRLGRLKFPWPLFAFPFYLWARSPGKTGSHYDPSSDLFQPSERRMVLTSDAFMLGMLGVLAAATAKLGVVAMFNLYLMP